MFEDIDCDAVTLKKALLDKFSKLVNGGGYQLCKCKAKTCDLMPLSASVLSSPRALQRCGSARTYICPLQKDLELTQKHHIEVGISHHNNY